MFIVIDPSEASCNRCVFAPDGHGMASWEFLRPVRSILWADRAAAEKVVKSYGMTEQLTILEVEAVRIPQETVLERVCEMFYLKK